MAKNALVFVHEAHEGPGQFGDILKEHGYTLTIIPTPQQDISGIDPLEADVLLVMGGPMGVYEADQYPFLNAEIEFLKKRLAADRPTLGICLGSQLMAAALGQEVFKGTKGKEIGWNPLALTQAASNHPVRHLSGIKTNMLHWHGDTYELPKGATLLASTDLYTQQAYSYRKNALALQCHPEITPRQFRGWLAESGVEVKDSVICENVEELRRQTEEHLDIMNAQAHLFFTEWMKETGLL